MKHRLQKYIKHIIELSRKKELTILPGNLAFYFLVSIIPVASITFYICTFFNASLEVITSFIKNTFSTDVVSMLNPIFIKHGFSIETLIFVVMAFFIATNGADAIIIASNSVFNIENKGIIRRRIKAIILTILIILLFSFMLFVPLFGGQILNMIHSSGIKNIMIYSFKILYPVLKIPISIIIMFFLIKAIYTIAPDEKVSSSSVNKGAIFTTTLWLLVTYGYSLYINTIAGKNFSIYYGSLANLIIVLMWFYFLAYVFVLGLIMNYRNVNKDIELTNTFKLQELNNKVSQIKLDTVDIKNKKTSK
ncbi:MAG: YihY/virulence factor BrkB family protein [Bacilli bacterium]